MMTDKITRLPPDVLQMRAREHLIYDAASGFLGWARPLTNRAVVGAEAGWVDETTGYRRLYFLGDFIYVHQIIWVMETGKFPTMIDHVNGDRTDNRWENLRIATPHQNMCNSKIRSNNTSGHKGVSFCKVKKKWYAYIRAHGKSIALGRYHKLEDAIAARLAGEAKYHGDFARRGA